ncbi:NUDIX domain-containing protein [Exiguobacterium artemiae]|uniref:NUDIX domain-containing protein n=1 Tax=Exiguobacterium artemiae TaxID=340145 RepID=UPI002964335A|nr:NUDIX domain-containing protein [Exiguobacterium sibiricum]MDW2886519.1 NUDIX domain-containing protein [Exiguobacterium sibiricum]
MMDSEQEKLSFGMKLKGRSYQYKQSVYGIVYDQRKQTFLTVETKLKNLLLPGGGIERGETPEQALHRELLEETGFTIRIEAPIGRAEQYLLAPSGEAILNDASFFEIRLLKQIQVSREPDHRLVWQPLQSVNELFYTHQAWGVGKGLTTD